MRGFDSIQNKFTELFYWASTFREAGVLLTKEPKERHKDITTTIENPLEYVLGVPEECVRGLPQMTIKTTTYIDSVYEKLSEVITYLPSEITVKQISFTEYEPITPSGTYYKPIRGYTKTIQPCLVIANFDKSLTDPGDVGPSFRWIPLGTGEHYQLLSLFCLGWHIINTWDFAEVLILLMMTDPTYGYSYLKQNAQDAYGADFNEGLFEDVYDKTQQIIQYFSAIRWIHGMIKRQLLPNASYAQILAYVADPSVVADYHELRSLENAYDLLKQVIDNHPPYIEEKVIDASYTVYDVGGTTGTVVTRRFTLNADGAYTQCSYEAKPGFSQSLIRNLRLFKQVVRPKRLRTPVETEWVYKTANIPCPNWDDVRSLVSDVLLTQYSRTSIEAVGVCDCDETAEETMNEVVDRIRELIEDDPSVVQASVRWSPLTGKLSATTSHITTVPYKSRTFVIY